MNIEIRALKQKRNLALAGEKARLSAPLSFLSWSISRIPFGFWFGLELCIAILAINLAYYISPQVGKSQLSFDIALVFIAAVLIGGMASGLYERSLLHQFTRLISSYISKLFITTILFTIASYLFFFGAVGRWILMIAIAAQLVISLTIRLAAMLLLFKFPIRILVVGKKQDMHKIDAVLKTSMKHYQMIGYCYEKKDASSQSIASIHEIEPLCRDKKVDLIIITQKYMDHPELLRNCFPAGKHGCVILDECSFYEEMLERVAVDRINESWFYSLQLNVNRKFPLMLKRGLDILFALVFLAILLPFFPVIALFIKLTSKGPVFYSQIRSGQYGDEFNIHKFRTMRLESEANGAQWASKTDPRVTSIGYLLRRTRLDEVPQFYNILKGDMSLVGPRPERPELQKEIEKQVPFFSFRTWARPGLTGLAQIRFRYGSSIEDARIKLEHDLYYIKHWSLLLDLKIIFQTILAIFRGAR